MLIVIATTTSHIVAECALLLEAALILLPRHLIGHGSAWLKASNAWIHLSHVSLWLERLGSRCKTGCGCSICRGESLTRCLHLRGLGLEFLNLGAHLRSGHEAIYLHAILVCIHRPRGIRLRASGR